MNKMNHIHTQSVMFLKTIHLPYRIAGTNLLENDDVIVLTLYNYVSSNDDPESNLHYISS
jgi:hypothetical protein